MQNTPEPLFEQLRGVLFVVVKSIYSNRKQVVEPLFFCNKFATMVVF